MKTEEDEAFDDLAKRQGAWGGGFKSKQDMAMHKTQDQNICRHYKQWQHCHICDLESQAAELAGIKAILDEYGLQAIDFVADFKAALAQPAQQEALYGMNQDDWKDVVAAIAKVRDGRGIYLGCRPADVFQEWFLALGTAKVKEKNG